MTQPIFHADEFYDIGDQGCAYGPVEKVAAIIRPMASGQTLEVHATDPAVHVDLSAWVRLAGHTMIKQDGHHYLIRRK